MLVRNRKTGFKCPRGCGKGSTSDACPGKVRVELELGPSMWNSASEGSGLP